MRTITKLFAAMIVIFGYYAWKHAGSESEPALPPDDGIIEKPLTGDPFIDGASSVGTGGITTDSTDPAPNLISSARDLISSADRFFSNIGTFGYELLAVVHRGLPPELRCLEGLCFSVIFILALIGLRSLNVLNRMLNRI